MERISIEVDAALLQRAQLELGVHTVTDTVNGALAEVIALDARRALLADAIAGQLADAADDPVMNAAWRRTPTESDAADPQHRGGSG